MYAFLTTWFSGQAVPRQQVAARSANVRSRPHPVAHDNHDDRWFDRLQSILTSVQRPASAALPNTVVLGVTGCASGDGATTVATNLAISAARSNKRVLLVDANFARPSLGAFFGLDPKCGLTDLLAGDESLDDLVQATSDSKLSVLVAGEPADPSLHDLMHLPAMMNRWRETYEVIILDLPVIGSSSSCRSIASLLDGVLLVVAAQETQLEAARQAKQRLIAGHANLLGVVLNEHR